jgi:hypothetical protein
MVRVAPRYPIFGLAKFVDEAGLAEQGVMYQLHRSPESLQYSKLSAASDIYQAGLTLYRMAAGLDEIEQQWQRRGDGLEPLKAVIEGSLHS